MKRLLFWTVATFCFVSCSTMTEFEDNTVLEGITPPDTLHASFDQSESDTRTYLEQDKYLRWTKGDEISFFPVTYNLRYRFDGETGDNNGSFTKITNKLVTGNALNNNYAVYPYKESTSMSDEGIISFELPAEQSYAPNSFGVGTNTMVATTRDSEDNILRFKNVCGFLKLQLYGVDVIVTSIEIKGNNNEKIAGASTITAAYGNSPIVEVQETAATSITLNCSDGVTLNNDASNPTNFWFVIPETTFEKGFTITVTDTQGATFIKSTSKPLSIERNTIQPMSALQVTPTFNTLYSIEFLKQDNPNTVVTDVIINPESENIVLCTPFISNCTKLIARFKTNGKRVTINNIEQISGTTVNDFSSPIVYTLQTDDKVKEYKITLSNTGLPIVMINTPNNATIPPKTADWLPDAEMKIYDIDGLIDFEGTTNIRGRGNSTWNYPKKPYALKLESKSKILGMPKHKRWVLLANWMDRTMIRNHIAFKTATLTGLEWTPRGEFVEVILNGKHIGNYYLCEHIKIDENRVNINEMEDTDTEGDAITGGYLMELDTYYDEVNKFKSTIKELPYMFSEPDEEALNVQQMTYMTNYINTLEESLYNDESFATRQYADLLDMDSFIDWWFVHELTGNWEPNAPKSCYMHKDKSDKLKAGPVWDFDYGTYCAGKAFIIQSAIYYDRLFQDPVFKARAKERWIALKDKFSTIPNFISSEAEKLTRSANLNIALWPLDGRTINQDESLSYQEATNKMKTWYQERVNWMDIQISSW